MILKKSDVAGIVNALVLCMVSSFFYVYRYIELSMLGYIVSHPSFCGYSGPHPILRSTTGGSTSFRET